MPCYICQPNSSTYEHSYFIIGKPYGDSVIYANSPEEAEINYRRDLAIRMRYGYSPVHRATAARLLRSGFRVVAVCDDWKRRYNLCPPSE